MRNILILSIFTIIAFVPFMAFADTFGERFNADTPNGLGEYMMDDVEIQNIAMDEVAEDLQDIMPASGEVAETEISVEPTVETKPEDI